MINNQSNKLYIGNINECVTEYQLKIILEKYGKIIKFDYLFHNQGDLIGKPRGYAFVEYDDIKEAIMAKEVLNNKLLFSKKLTVQFTNNQRNHKTDKKSKNNNQATQLSLQKSSQQPLNMNTSSKIEAFERKLKLMEK